MAGGAAGAGGSTIIPVTGGGGGAPTPAPATPPPQAFKAGGLFFPLSFDSHTHEARVMTSARADSMQGKINSSNRSVFTRFGVSVGARTDISEQFFPSSAKYINALAQAKNYGLSPNDLLMAKQQILQSGNSSGLDPRILQWLHGSGFLKESFFRGPIGFKSSYSGLDDDSNFIQRIDFFGSHAAGEIVQALDDAVTFYGMDAQANGNNLSIKCDGVDLISTEYDKDRQLMITHIKDDIPLENIDAALRTLVFLHCSSASSSDSNIFIPDFGDNVIENIRGLQILLYEAHMHIIMSHSDYQNELAKIDKLLNDGEITPQYAKALKNELTYIYRHCQTFSDKPQRDRNGYRQVMNYPYSSGDYGRVSAGSVVKEFGARAQNSAILLDKNAWEKQARRRPATY